MVKESPSLTPSSQHFWNDIARTIRYSSTEVFFVFAFGILTGLILCLAIIFCFSKSPRNTDSDADEPHAAPVRRTKEDKNKKGAGRPGNGSGSEAEEGDAPSREPKKTR
jgi:hypothetical protein